MKQVRIVLETLLLVSFCFSTALGRLHQRHLTGECEDLTSALLGEDTLPEKTRCFLAGGKYCSPTVVPPSDSFEYVGDGCCLDSDGKFLDWVHFADPLTLEECKNSCISVMDSVNSPLRGLLHDIRADKDDCYCYFDDGVILNIPEGVSDLSVANSGNGKVTSTDAGCRSATQCYSYNIPVPPPHLTGSFYPVGEGCCISKEYYQYDSANFVDPISLEDCKDKCEKVMGEIGSLLRGLQRGTNSDTDNSTCNCLFDDGAIQNVPNGASSVSRENYGKGEVEKATTSDSSCPYLFGKCFRYTPSRQPLGANFTTNTPLSGACISPECDSAQSNCTVSTCIKFEKGIDYPFNDINTVPATDPADCCDACKTNPNCQFFSWRKDLSLCFLKDRKGDARKNSEVITGYIAQIAQKRC
jgi:hypothetical protein